MLWWGALGLISLLKLSESIRWPAGTYGIPKPTSGCPWADGFQWQEGWVSQDTNGYYSNNDKSTEFHLDGVVNNQKVNRSFCIKTNTENDKNRSAWPKGCNETLTGVNGTFHSPNYPQKYPNVQYCSWRITVSPSQQIHLTFTNFSLQIEKNADSLNVYDGANATGEVLGVFYGGHPPPKEGIYSSSNHMFLIFKSDNNGSYIGFSASYNAVNYSVSTVATTTTHIPEVTSSHIVTPKTLEKATSSREPLSKEGGNRKQKDQSQEKGVNMLAIVIPVVALVFIIALLVAGFFYCKRRRTKRKEQGTPKQVVYSRPNGEIPMSLENPCYGRSLIVENTAFPSKDNELYAEVKEENKNEETYGQQESDNPLYETAGGDAVFNPIYDSSICS